ncbi:hypothetical protein RZU89_02220 [Campylobacter coli]
MGYLKVLVHGKFDYFNIGIDKPEISVKELSYIYAKYSKEIFNFEPQVNFAVSEDKNYLKDNPNRRCPIIDKARNKLQYNPTILVEDGVRRFLKFLKFEKENGSFYEVVKSNSFWIRFCWSYYSSWICKKRL